MLVCSSMMTLEMFKLIYILMHSQAQCVGHVSLEYLYLVCSAQDFLGTSQTLTLSLFLLGAF